MILLRFKNLDIIEKYFAEWSREIKVEVKKSNKRMTVIAMTKKVNGPMMGERMGARP